MKTHVTAILHALLLSACLGSNPAVPNDATTSDGEDATVSNAQEDSDSTQIGTDAVHDAGPDATADTEDSSADVADDLSVLPSYIEISILTDGEFEPINTTSYEFRDGFGMGPGTASVSTPTNSGTSFFEFSWSIWMEFVNDRACFDVELADEVQERRCVSSRDETLEYPFSVDEHQLLFSVRFE